MAHPDRPLRVLTVTNMWREKGDFRGTFVNEQVDSIRALGHHVDVEVIAQSRGRRDYFLAIPRVRRRVKQGNYDVIHIHYGMTALAARFVGRVPRVVMLHGRDVFRWWQWWMTRLGWGGATRIFTSRRLAQLAKDPDAAVVACGVDVNLFTPGDQARARRELGIEHDEPIVLFGASPANLEKDYDLFTMVLDELRSRGLRVHELILAEPGLPRERVVTKFAASDVLLLTSQKGTETGPLVVKEATVTNLPVVSTDVGDVPDVLAGIDRSFCVPWPHPWADVKPARKQDPAARTQLVTTLADHVEKVLATRGRSNGRDFKDRVDLHHKALAIVDIYRSLIR